MPRVQTSQRQKNKPFKTKKTKNKSSSHKTAKTTKTKPIGKAALRKQRINKSQLVKDIKQKKVR